MALETRGRFKLAALPTPLDEAPHLTKALGGPRILIKRDDLTGLALGGNKTRKLEYLIADAIAQKSDVVITAGAAQSNHCRQAAAAARKAGMRSILVLTRSEHNEMQGNLLLDALLDADIRMFVGGPDFSAMAAMEKIADEERGLGHTPYIIPIGGSNGIGALGYAHVVLEMQNQFVDRGIHANYLYAASGSGGTQGGLVLGTSMFSAPYKVVGVSPGGKATGVREACMRTANEAAELLELKQRFTADDFIVHDEYVGPGYAIPTAASNEAIRLFAQTEALIIDPVYTAKAAAGMIDHIRRGVISRDSTVVFLHTGGTPALFAYHAEVASALEKARAGV